MPYIDDKTKELLEPEIEKLVNKLIENPAIIKPGTLNYIITRLCVECLDFERFMDDGQLSYHNISRYRAALHDAFDEIYRRLLGPYEDNAIQKNGDVKELKALVEKIKPPVT